MLRKEEVERIIHAARSVTVSEGQAKLDAEAELQCAIDEADRVAALRKPTSHGERTLTDSTSVTRNRPCS